MAQQLFVNRGQVLLDSLSGSHYITPADIAAMSQQYQQTQPTKAAQAHSNNNSHDKPTATTKKNKQRQSLKNPPQDPNSHAGFVGRVKEMFSDWRNAIPGASLGNFIRLGIGIGESAGWIEPKAENIPAGYYLGSSKGYRSREQQIKDDAAEAQKYEKSHPIYQPPAEVESGEFNPETLQNYYDFQDWSGAANYIEQFKAKDAKSAVELNQAVTSLRRQAAIDAARRESMDSDGIDAYEFMQGLAGKSVMPKEGYGAKYTEAINKQIETFGTDKFSATFDDNDSYNAFLSRLPEGTRNSVARKVRKTKDGKVYLPLSAKDDNLMQVFDAMTNNDATMEGFGDILSYGWDYTTDNLGTMIPILSTALAPLNIYKASIRGDLYDQAKRRGIHLQGVLDGKADRLTDSGYTGSLFGDYPLQAAYRTYRSAKGKMDDWQNNQDETEFTEDTAFLPFLGQQHLNLYKALEAGAIKPEQFKTMSAEINRQYVQRLSGTSLKDYDVYSNRDTKGNESLGKVDADEKGDIIDKILVASQDGDRLEIGAGMVGDKMGAYITIKPKKNEKGEGYDGDLDDDRAKEVIFIPGLFAEDAQVAFQNNTQTKSTVEKSDMKKWGYERRLSNDTALGYDKDGGSFYIVDDKGKKTYCDDSTALQTLNQDYIVNDAAGAIVSQMDADGNIYDYDNNGNRVKVDLGKWVETQAAAATNELYPEGKYSTEERLKQQALLYQAILKQIAYITDFIGKDE